MPRTASSDEAREKGQNRQRQVELTQNLAVPAAYLVMNVTIDKNLIDSPRRLGPAERK
jgi:hypothetical protein